MILVLLGAFMLFATVTGNLQTKALFAPALSHILLYGQRLGDMLQARQIRLTLCDFRCVIIKEPTLRYLVVGFDVRVSERLLIHAKDNSNTHNVNIKVTNGMEDFIDF